MRNHSRANETNLTTLNLHDRIIGNLPPRPWMRSQSYLLHTWEVVTEEQRLPDASPVRFYFDIPMRPWPNFVTLTDPSLELDLITGKLFVFNSLEPKPIGWAAAATAQRDWNRLQAFTRWRIDRGIASNSLLTEPWHREYFNSLCQGGYGGLVRANERLEALLEAERDGLIRLPIEALGKRRRLRTDTVAEMLGFCQASQLPKDTQKRIDAYINQHGLWKNRRTYPRQPAATEKPFTIREETAISLLEPWHQLSKLSKQLAHDPIGYQPYKNVREIRKSVKRWVDASEPTGDIPPYQAAYLIDASVKLVLDCGDLIREVVPRLNSFSYRVQMPKRQRNRELSRLTVDLRHQASTIGPVVPRYISRRPKVQQGQKIGTEISLRMLIFIIFPAACAVVIAAFSARRDDEIMTLLADSIRTDERGDSWLVSYVGKNLKSRQEFPVPASVRLAVDALRSISSCLHREGRASLLLKFTCPLSGQNIGFDLSEAVQVLAQWVQVPVLPNGSYWHFTSRQFRRFFSITYFWRYHYPSLTALSYHLEHYNPNTTRGYIALAANHAALRMRDEQDVDRHHRAQASRGHSDDIDRENDFIFEARRFVRILLQEVADSKERLGGRGGQDLNAQLDALRASASAQIDVAAHESEEESFNRFLNAWAENVSLIPHPEGHGLCKCRKDRADLLAARCLIEREIDTGQSAAEALEPDHSYAEDVVCAGCVHNVQLEIFDPYWSKAEVAAKNAIEHQRGDALDNAQRRHETIVNFRDSQPWNAK